MLVFFLLSPFRPVINSCTSCLCLISSPSPSPIYHAIIHFRWFHAFLLSFIFNHQGQSHYFFDGQIFSLWPSPPPHIQFIATGSLFTVEYTSSQWLLPSNHVRVKDNPDTFCLLFCECQLFFFLWTGFVHCCVWICPADTPHTATMSETASEEYDAGKSAAASTSDGKEAGTEAVNSPSGEDERWRPQPGVDAAALSASDNPQTSTDTVSHPHIPLLSPTDSTAICQSSLQRSALACWSAYSSPLFLECWGVCI